MTRREQDDRERVVERLKGHGARGEAYQLAESKYAREALDVLVENIQARV